MNNKGFISISVIYSFFIVFLLMLLFIIDNLVNDRLLLNNLKDTIKSEIKVNINDDDKELSFVDFITNLYTGVQGENNIYYHDGTLEYGVNDGSYRYSGSYETTNNWICFGSDEVICPENNLYRIIGVFNEPILNEDGTDSIKKEKRVKLIMNNYPGESVLGTSSDNTDSPYSEFTGLSKPIGDQPTYAWSGTTGNSNDWGHSDLRKTTLNGTKGNTYLTILGDTWNDKIAITKWKVGVLNNYGPTSAATYQDENGSLGLSRTINNKVGLMYPSDYGFAASQSCWSLPLTKYSDDTIRNNNWLYRGMSEWTITPYIYNALHVYALGSLVNHSTNVHFAIRPVFYLKSSVLYVDGDGTQNNPFRIN